MSSDGKEGFYDYYEPPKTLVKSAVRVINVLEYFYRNRKPARVADVSKALDYPFSSTKYLLSSLVDSGYLTFDKSAKTYFPSILFSGLAAWLHELYPGGEALRRLAREVHQKWGGTVSVTVQHQQYMRAMIIEMEGEATPPSYDFRSRIPLVGSGGGLAALASMSDKDVTDLINWELGKLSPERRSEKSSQVKSEIKRTREQGYAVKEHVIETEGTTASFLVVAVPIPVEERSAPMVLALTAPRSHLAGRESDVALNMKALLDEYRQYFLGPTVTG